MSIAAVIQHHPRRAHLLPKLLKGLAPIPTGVVEDPEPNARPSAWRTHSRCLQSFPEGATHVLVVQDDATLARDLAAYLPRVVEAQPERVISLWRAGHFRCVRTPPGPWHVLDRTAYVDVVALVWPVPMRDAFLSWLEDNPPPARYDRDDAGIVTRWMHATGTEIVATVPSLVEHLGYEPSLFGTRYKPQTPSRRAAVYIGDKSALELGSAAPPRGRGGMASLDTPAHRCS